MRILLYILFISVGLFSSSFSVYGSHAAGAELSYKHLSGSSYEFTFVFYRDCDGISAPSTETINFENTCGFTIPPATALQSFLIIGNDTLYSGDELSPVCQDALGFTSCQSGPLVGLGIYIYKAVVTLPTCGLIKASAAVTARNASIDNLLNPDTWDLYVETNFDNTVVLDNSSVVFSQPFVLTACAGEVLHFNPGGYDADGDSVVYSLVQPLDNSFTTVPYVFPYSITYPITTTTGDFPFDPETGQINFIPDVEQVGAIVVKADEFRDGVWISSTMRDFQLTITNCSFSTAVPQTNSITSVTGGILVDSNSAIICPGDAFQATMEFTDADLSDTLELRSNIDFVIPDATVSLSGVNPLIYTVSWTPSLADTGRYYFQTYLEDNVCPYPGISVFGFDFEVKETPSCPIGGCPTPTGVIDSLISSTSVAVYWNPVAAASNYILEARKVPAMANTFILPNNTATYTKLKPLSTYEWRVAADCGAAGVSSFSSVRTINTPMLRIAPKITLLNNPSKNVQIQIETDSETEVSLIDQMGKVHFQTTINNTQFLNTDYLPHGLYHLVVNSGSVRETSTLLLLP